MASTTQSILQESLNTALKDYYQSELAVEEVKNARERESRLWMGIIGGLILLGVVAIFVHRLRSKDKLLELQIAQYAAVQRDNAHLIGSLISQRLRHMDKLSDEYFTADEKKKKDIVFASFKSYLEEFRNDKDAFKSLEDFLNKYSNGIMDKLEKQVPRINGDNRRIISLFFAGLPYETIQLIFKRVSIGSLRTLRSRFRLEIKNANAPDAKLFLLMLETKKGGQQTNKK